MNLQRDAVAVAKLSRWHLPHESANNHCNE
jgi:hypothetical protein